MKHAVAITLVVEGPSDESVLRRILRDHKITLSRVLGLQGKDYLDKRLANFNLAARHGNWLVVRDLDEDADCPARLARVKLPAPSKGMCFRVAVRSVEAWLLADAEGIASFLKVATHQVPHSPESLQDPKGTLVRLAARSRSREIREDMVPASGTTAQVGPAFVSRIVEFTGGKWNWRRAQTRSDSLKRCVNRIAELVMDSHRAF